jgi:hypothetical protein
MKKLFISLLAIMAFSINAYAENNQQPLSYTNNTQQQQIENYKANGYQFFNIGDGFHTIKPNETVCGEILKPADAPGFAITPIINVNKFKANFSMFVTKYINFNISETRGCFGKWVAHKPSFISKIYTWYIDSPDIEGKMCFQNVSNITNIDIEFLLRPDGIRLPHKNNISRNNIYHLQNQEFGNAPIVCGS